MTQIEKILAEIQRLKKELKDYSATEALDYIESYVNLVAREQHSIPSNLEEAEWQKQQIKSELLQWLEEKKQELLTEEKSDVGAGLFAAYEVVEHKIKQL